MMPFNPLRLACVLCGLLLLAILGAIAGALVETTRWLRGLR